ncbi:transcription factor e(y)2-domain-containing protein [Kockovaella imperatae]|uniref:Transcription and mRNA export factor SUS1 n=1 Tax=Kockovaella imperatae TaxID=4999 RepID=A0A1Y1U628_9TREE|nr:transcription factor e(y)2-domain-containing protein [Kockovaella imperatae]ORX33483.1 transcription factor e(y)2-domain-containing protein [Kockovaella imperatae]
MSGAKPDEEVMDQIKKRLLETGDWERISRALRAQLEEAGWEDELKDLAKERVRAQSTPSLQALLEEISAQANKMIPPHIQKAVQQEIEAALEREVEPA